MKYKSTQIFSTWDAPGIIQATKAGQVFETPRDLTQACANRLEGSGHLVKIEEKLTKPKVTEVST